MPWEQPKKWQKDKKKNKKGDVEKALGCVRCVSCYHVTVHHMEVAQVTSGELMSRLSRWMIPKLQRLQFNTG